MPSETTGTTAATATKSPNETKLTPPRTPVNRLRLMAVCLVCAAFAAFLSAGEAYYTMNISDVAVTTPSLRDVDGVAVTASVTGRQLVAQSATAPTIGTGGNLANDSSPSGYLGLPNAVVLLLGAALAGIVATVMCSAFAAVVGSALAFFAFRSFGNLTSLVENSSAGGALVERGAGLQLLQIALIVISVTVGSALVQTVMIALERRRYRQALAKAEKKEPEPTIIDWLRGAAAAGTSMVESHARRAASDRADGEKSKS